MLDQFYTSNLIAELCIKFIEDKISAKKRIQYLEPSAGTGSFSSKVQNCIAVDLDPKSENIIKGNFLELSKEDLKLMNPEKVCVIGNPPFGKVSSLAVKFFNHAAKMADTICFIVPRTFKKNSIQKRLDVNFHLLFEYDLPKKSFVFNGEAYDVPCVFQIWEKRDIPRVINQKIENPLFWFVPKHEAQAAIRRVGGRTGKASLTFNEASETSNYFIKSKGLPIEQIVNLINSMDFSHIINSTAGVRSLSKQELNRELINKIAAN